jgi:hypothetical protein
MQKRSAAVIGACTVVIAFVMAVSVATARRLELSEQRYTVQLRELAFREVGSEATLAACPVTLEGSFHSKTLSKVCGQLIGYITRATKGTCQTGAVTILSATLPWHVRYESFRGTLPAISEIDTALANGGWQIEIFGLSCLYESTAAGALREIIVRDPATGRIIEWIIHSRIIGQGGAFCPREVILDGRGSVGTQTRLEPITVRLVQ